MFECHTEENVMDSQCLNVKDDRCRKMTCDCTFFLDSISVTGRCESDNENGTYLQLKRCPSPAGLELGTTRSAGQRLIQATVALVKHVV